jgi:hypothetical protein
VRSLKEQAILRKSLLFLGMIVLLLAAASSGSYAPTVLAQSTNANTGNLRVVNALVGIGPVDIFLDGERIGYALQPKQATPYYFVAAGSHQLTVRRINADELSVPIADTLINLAPDTSLTAIAYQKVFASSGGSSPSLDQSGKFFIMTDDRSPIALGRSRLAVADLAVGTPQRLSIGYRSGEALLYQVSLEQPYGTIDVDSGIQTLAVLDADSPSLNILSNFGDFSFYSNTLYTLVVVPNVIPTTSNAVGTISATPQMFIVSASLNPPQTNGLRIRIVHAAHDTAVLDVYIDQRLVASRLNYTRYTEYLALANYGHTITLRRFGDPATAPPLGQAVFTITPENKDQVNWTLLLVNATNASTLATNAPDTTNAPVIISTPGGSVIAAILPDNISATQRDFARVRLINAVDGLQSVGLYTPAYPVVPLPAGVVPTRTPVPTVGPPTPVTLIDPVAFGAEANDQEIPVGVYRELDFAPAGVRTNLFQLLNQQLAGGMVYTYVAMGSPTGNPPIQVITLQDFGTGVPTTRLYVGTVVGSIINVRAGASTSSAVVGSLNRDDQVSIYGRTENSQWLRVHYVTPLGVAVDGWISAAVGIRITRLGAPVTIAALPVYNGP